jgi:hypothetical protein
MNLPAGPRFVAYYRVSTDQQGRSGLGLDAQREAVARHAAGCGGTVAAVFEEVESGRRRDRPQLALAMAECRLRRAVLLIAKLDRLARDAHFLLGLEKAGVEFLAADMPYANRLTIGVMALVAEERPRHLDAHEGGAGCGQGQGTKLGNPRLQAGRQRHGRRGSGCVVDLGWAACSGGAALSRRRKQGRSHDPAAARRCTHCPWRAHATGRGGVAAMAGQTSAESGCWVKWCVGILN